VRKAEVNALSAERAGLEGEAEDARMGGIKRDEVVKRPPADSAGTGGLRRSGDGHGFSLRDSSAAAKVSHKIETCSIVVIRHNDALVDHESVLIHGRMAPQWL
jgi:hypothetical protein